MELFETGNVQNDAPLAPSRQLCFICLFRSRTPGSTDLCCSVCPVGPRTTGPRTFLLLLCFTRARSTSKLGSEVRMSTTAYATTVGLSKDPTVSLRVELVARLDVASHAAVSKKGLDVVWEKLAESLLHERRWSRVRGPMGASSCCYLEGPQAGHERGPYSVD